MTSCSSCGAPMGTDQRYCLECGSRAHDARLPFLDLARSVHAPHGELLPPPTVVGAGVPFVPRGPRTAQERLQANTGLIAGVGVLLLAMLIGVLIGSGLGGDSPQAAAAPQIISVGGGGGVAAPVGATGADGTTGVATPAKKAAKAKKSGAKAAKAPAASAKPAKATNSAVKKLDTLTGKAALKAVDKLGKTIPTGGKAPKRDAKPAAGGGSFEDIG